MKLSLRKDEADTFLHFETLIPVINIEKANRFDSLSIT